MALRSKDSSSGRGERRRRRLRRRPAHSGLPSSLRPFGKAEPLSFFPRFAVSLLLLFVPVPPTPRSCSLFSAAAPPSLLAVRGFVPRPSSSSSPRARRRRRRAAGGEKVDGDGGSEGGGGAWNASVKDLKVCSVLGGLDLTRLHSFNARSVFRSAIEDVELLREYYTEAMYNDGLRGGLPDLSDMAATLDWEARNLTANDTTLTAGLGWTDDRRDRRVERHVTLPREPLVGTKQSDMDIMDMASNLLPWMLDRRSKENEWYRSHQNGRSEGVSKELLPFDSLYIGVWGVTWGGALLYYPPMSYFQHPYTFGDILSGEFDYRSIPATPPGWPFRHKIREGGTVKDAIFGHPYADIAHPGLSMISALAPIYYTGDWRGHRYDDTYLGVAGVDITLDAIAGVLDDLEDGLCRGSFALLADADTFEVVALSQSVVERIYPERTGMEEERVTRLSADNSIVDDRRNQTYYVSDTIWQSLLQGLNSADWKKLHSAVRDTDRGDRGYITLDMTLTGETASREYYAMFDRWASVSEWVVLVFAPVDEIDGAIRPSFVADESMHPHPVDMVINEGDGDVDNGEGTLEVVRTSEAHIDVVQGEVGLGRATLLNNGTLGIVVRPSGGERSMPRWMRLTNADEWKTKASDNDGGGGGDDGVALRPGESILVAFEADASDSNVLGLGTTTAPLSFDVHDDEYPNCLHRSSVALQVSVRVSPEPNLNQLSHNVRVGGLLMCALVLAAAAAFVAWTRFFRATRVVRASQPRFLVMICFGCFVLGCTIVPLSVDDGNASLERCDVACMAAPWLFSMGFVIMFAALFSKIWRINKIFHHSQFRRITVTERDVLVPFAVLFVFNFVFLLCWTLVDPLVWTRVKVGEWDSYGVCASKGKASIAFVSIVAAIDVAALVLACVQAYLARDIGDEYSESKFIGIALGGMLQVAVIGVPLIFLVRENPTATFFIESGLVFVIAMSVLLLVFVPKVLYMKSAKKRLAAKRARALKVTMENAAFGIGRKDGEAVGAEGASLRSGSHHGIGAMSTDLNVTDRSSDELDNSDSGTPGLRITHVGGRFADAVLRTRLELASERVEALESILAQHGIDYERILETDDVGDGDGQKSPRDHKRAVTWQEETEKRKDITEEEETKEEVYHIEKEVRSVRHVVDTNEVDGQVTDRERWHECESRSATPLAQADMTGDNPDTFPPTHTVFGVEGDIEQPLDFRETARTEKFTEDY